MDADDCVAGATRAASRLLFASTPGTDVVGSYALDVSARPRPTRARAARAGGHHQRIVELVWSNPLIHTTVIASAATPCCVRSRMRRVCNGGRTTTSGSAACAQGCSWRTLRRRWSITISPDETMRRHNNIRAMVRPGRDRLARLQAGACPRCTPTQPRVCRCSGRTTVRLTHEVCRVQVAR